MLRKTGQYFKNSYYYIIIGEKHLALSNGVAHSEESLQGNFEVLIFE